jgi:protein CpxP
VGMLAAQAPGGNAAAPQEQTHRTVDPQKQLDHLAKKLALSADQQGQILPILTDRQQQIAAINSDTTLTEKQRHAKMKAVRSDSESRLRNVLTDTQRASYDQMQQQARERAQARRQGNAS